MDKDLEHFTKEQLIGEVRRLCGGIREHRDSTKHELCWHHPQLWGLLPEKIEPHIAVPAWPQFLRGCLRYRESLDIQRPDAPRIKVSFSRLSHKLPNKAPEPTTFAVTSRAIVRLT
jgi:hypothetical protein